jgi:hypothetical protein
MANEGKAFGEPAKAYAIRLALEQLTGKSTGESYSNAHMERGHEQEPIARMLYEQEHFARVENGGFFDGGNFGCSPDGLVGTDGLIEIKSVIASTHYSTLTRGSFDQAYKWQLVGNLEGTRREWIDFVSYCAEFPEGNQLLVYRLHYQKCEEMIASLRKRREEFLNLVCRVKSDIENYQQVVAA